MLYRLVRGYGLFKDADPLSLEELQLPEERLPHYRRVLDAVRRDARAVADAPGLAVTKEAVERYVREAGGTWINRASVTAGAGTTTIDGSNSNMVTFE